MKTEETKNETSRFRLTTTCNGILYSPANDAARLLIPKGRKCLKAFELEQAIKDGHAVEINLSGYLGGHFWVSLNPVS